MMKKVSEWDIWEAEREQIAKTQHDKFKAAEKVMEEERARFESADFILKIIRGLKAVAQESDPGKYGPAYLYRQGGSKYVLPIGLVKEKGCRYPLVDKEKLETAKCPKCKEQHTLIIEHYQTEDADDGDEWQLRTLVICCARSDGEVVELSKRTSGARLL